MQGRETHSQSLLQDMLAERERQIAKFGAQLATPIVPESWYTHRPCMKEMDAKSACDMAFAADKGSWAHIMAEELAEAIDAESPDDMRMELVQLATTVMGAIEALDSQHGRFHDPMEPTDAPEEMGVGSFVKIKGPSGSIGRIIGERDVMPDHFYVRFVYGRIADGSLFESGTSQVRADSLEIIGKDVYEHARDRRFDSDDPKTPTSSGAGEVT